MFRIARFLIWVVAVGASTACTIPPQPLHKGFADLSTGLYIREMLTRRLISRVLIVPPAGLVGNWEHEMRHLFNLSFRIVSGGDARASV